MQMPLTPSGMNACSNSPWPAARSAARVVYGRNPTRVPQMNEAVALHRAHARDSAALARQLGF